jgi:glutamate 5-kinase
LSSNCRNESGVDICSPGSIMDIDINEYDSNSKSNVGTGGFKTKLQAVKIASTSGTDTIVASGFEKDVLTKIMNQDDIGTYFKSN